MWPANTRVCIYSSCRRLSGLVLAIFNLVHIISRLLVASLLLVTARRNRCVTRPRRALAFGAGLPSGRRG